MSHHHYGTVNTRTGTSWLPSTPSMDSRNFTQLYESAVFLNKFIHMNRMKPSISLSCCYRMTIIESPQDYEGPSSHTQSAPSYYISVGMYAEELTTYCKCEGLKWVIITCNMKSILILPPTYYNEFLNSSSCNELLNKNNRSIP